MTVAAPADMPAPPPALPDTKETVQIPRKPGIGDVDKSGVGGATDWGTAYSPSWDLPRQLNAEAKPDKFGTTKTVNVGFRRDLASKESFQDRNPTNTFENISFLSDCSPTTGQVLKVV